METYPYLAIQRNLQILGAFSFLSRIKGKNYFETYIPIAFKSLETLLSHMKDPELNPLKTLISTIRFSPVSSGLESLPNG